MLQLGDLIAAVYARHSAHRMDYGRPRKPESRSKKSVLSRSSPETRTLIGIIVSDLGRPVAVRAIVVFAGASRTAAWSKLEDGTAPGSTY